ncbi:MAG: hypothetical protein LBB43_00995 [Spirochaetaceae bacterium]|jgi:hypothetical protein|nr:hypothetical protein [Spirochaetaceae bacterium]
MKKLKALLLVSVLSTASVFSVDIGGLKDTVGEFSSSMAGVLPFTSTVGLNWSDAYIGNFPHFGVGLSGGFTSMNVRSFDTLLEQFGVSMPEWLSLSTGALIPAYALEARLGGFILPFDIGVKFGYIPKEIKDFLGEGLRFDYLMVGADIRYAVIRENLILPNVSVGLGYNYLRGGIGTTLPVNQNFFIGTEKIAVSNPDLDLMWETSGIDVNAQISKSLLIFTPYLGLGATYSQSSAGYEISAKLADADKDRLEDIGVEVAGDGFSFKKKSDGWGYRAFGGLSFNLAFIRFDLTAMYSFGGDAKKIGNMFNGTTDFEGNWGLSFGIRFQL